MTPFWDRLPMRDAIAFQLVRYDRSWFLPMRLQQTFEEPFGCFAVTATLKKHIDNLAILIDSPPQIVLHMSNLNEHFV
jgi:hypothetical protein